MADVFDFELHEARTDGKFDDDSDDIELDDVSYLRIYKRKKSFSIPFN